MKATQSLEIIESMLQESKKSLHRNSFYFILWGLLMVPAGIAESLLIDSPNFWLIWPIMGIIGGIISMIYGMKEGKRTGTVTSGDRIISYTWGAFVFCLVFVIVFSLSLRIPPHTLILMLAGMATFISGGISKFKPFVYGGIAMEIGALACAFVVAPEYQGYVSALSLFVGYVIPGFMLKKAEDGQA